MSEHGWRVVRRDDEQPWPCTIVDQDGKSLVDIVDGTPVIRDADLAEQIVGFLNARAVAASGPRIQLNFDTRTEYVPVLVPCPRCGGGAMGVRA